MIAWRGNVILVFLKIYLILGFLTIFVFSEDEEWINNNRRVFLEAACTADCEGVSELYLLIYILIRKISSRWQNLNVNFVFAYFGKESASCVSFRCVKSGGRWKVSESFDIITQILAIVDIVFCYTGSSIQDRFRGCGDFYYILSQIIPSLDLQTRAVNVL